MTPQKLIYLPIKVGTLHLRHANNISIKAQANAYVTHYDRDVIDACPQIFDAFLNLI
jgi:hypothetical protein